jgi:hypothetical protein
MARFKDAKSREWDVAIDVSQIRKVRERLKFELGKLLADDLKRLNELAEDPCLLVDVLYLLCEEQAARTGVEAEEFGRGFAGGVIGDAFDALVGSYADFCPSQQRQTIAALLAKTKALELEAGEKARAAIERISLTTMLSDGVGKPAESAESTPTPEG